MIEESELVRRVAMSENLAAIARQLQSADNLEDLLSALPVEKARKILRWLRNLRDADKDMEEWLDQGSALEQIDKAEALQQIILIYAAQLREARKTRPDIIHDDDVENANDAVYAMALGVAEHTLAALPENHPRARLLETLIDAFPKRCELRITQSISQLLKILERGIERVSQKPVSEQLPVDRLMEMSARIQATARQLRSVDSMESPAREESIELAREILRKLKNLMFSDKPLIEALEAGDIENKESLAQKISEMADVYKNLLFEAAQFNPGILQDPRIKEANDAVGSFAHAVGLMAAKEIPNSLAASQQISADVTQTPEEWKNLHHHTVGRLMQSMEGGLEQAVSELMVVQQEQQQQDQQQAEKLAQEVSESAHGHSDHGHRKKRKRRHHRASHGSGKKHHPHAHHSHAAEEYIKQGRFNRDSVKAADPQLAQTASLGLKPEDLATVRQLGGSLLSMGKQANTLPAVNVSASDKITPDDKDFVTRDRDTKLSPQNTPKQRL